MLNKDTIEKGCEDLNDKLDSISMQSYIKCLKDESNMQPQDQNFIKVATQFVQEKALHRYNLVITTWKSNEASIQMLFQNIGSELAELSRTLKMSGNVFKEALLNFGQATLNPQSFLKIAEVFKD